MKNTFIFSPREKSVIAVIRARTDRGCNPENLKLWLAGLKNLRPAFIVHAFNLINEINY